MSADTATAIATIGKWSGLIGGLLTTISAFSLALDYNSTTGIDFLAWHLLAFAYLLITLCNKYVIKSTRACTITEEFYSDVAAALAVIYACYEIAVYYLQLTYIRGARQRGADPIAISLVEDMPGSPIFAIDMLGYFVLSISTIFLALSLRNQNRVFLTRLLYFHGAVGSTCFVVPFLPMIYEEQGEDDIIWQVVIVFWCVQFAPICFLMSNYFGSFVGAQKRE